MPDASDELSVRVRVYGRVQGVAFRAWTVDEAGARGLRGWVRNRRDGSVEAVFVGPTAAVRAMIEACRRGPAAARVSGIEVEGETAAETGPDDGSEGGGDRAGVGGDFRQLPTY